LYKEEYRARQEDLFWQRIRRLCLGAKVQKKKQAAASITGAASRPKFLIKETGKESQREAQSYHKGGEAAFRKALEKLLGFEVASRSPAS